MRAHMPLPMKSSSRNGSRRFVFWVSCVAMRREPGRVGRAELGAGIGAWRLASAPPDAPLAGLVKEFWEVEGALDAFRETLLPNGCTELMINLGPPHDL